jgi:hypothetical protein
MREKLNENPVAQVALIAILVVVGGYMLLSTMGGGESGGSEAAASAPAEAGTEAPAEVAVEEGSLEAATPVAATSAISAPANGPLPADVEQAYAEDKTVALLIFRAGGIDDDLVGLAAGVLRDNPRVALFDVPAKKISNYAAITGPLGVNQAPALVVISPKRLNGGAPAPATVTYGFQSAADIVQAVVDAGYKGPQLTYAPN